eukprot:7757544-Alexandrium_andersonii.AAC.1
MPGLQHTAHDTLELVHSVLQWLELALEFQISNYSGLGRNVLACPHRPVRPREHRNAGLPQRSSGNAAYITFTQE